MSSPEPELYPPMIPSKGYRLELVTGPRDSEDEWLRLHGDCDEGR